jgi:ADP-heptose:LPS heptosyltransferase
MRQRKAAAIFPLSELQYYWELFCSTLRSFLIHPDMMRRLDCWIGIPLCWALTLLRRSRARLSAFFSVPAVQPAAPRRVLFVLLSECGSMVLADPALRSLAGDAKVEPFLLTFEHNRPALAITGTLPDNRIFSLRADSLFTLFTDFWRWLRWLRQCEIDSIVDLELFACLTAVLCACSGLRRRVGFHAAAGGVGRYRGDLYTHKVAYDPQQHISLNYFALADAVLERKPAPDPVLPLPAQRVLQMAEVDAVQSLFSNVLPDSGESPARMVLINPNASELLPQRRWPVPHFLELIRLLLQRHANLNVLLIGGPSDLATTAAIAASVANPRCVDIAGRLGLPELPALFAAATVMVSNDSGPAHFAAVSDLPVVVLFGPETPTLYRPLGQATVLSAGLPCSPCVNVGNQRRSSCRDNRCMRSIAVDTVLAAVEAILAGPVHRRVMRPPVGCGQDWSCA